MIESIDVAKLGTTIRHLGLVPGSSADERKLRLTKMSHGKFLRDTIVRVDQMVLS